MSRRISIPALLVALSLGGCITTSRVATSVDATRTEASERAPRIVYGDLDIANQESLERYADLAVVTGTLTIIGNTRLQNLDGLSRLRSVGHLVITENLALENIEGLAGLQQAKSLTINGNPRLENLHGLESLRTLDRLVLTANGIFCTRGLDGLNEVGDLVVAKNSRLLSLRGFAHLRSATNVSIVQNPRLFAHPRFLAELTCVHRKLDLSRNAGLASSDVRSLYDRVKTGVRITPRIPGTTAMTSPPRRLCG